MAIFKRTNGVEKRGFLARLGRDVSGNVFAMTAAAVVPMIGVVGGAIDASRMYLVRSRLQAACDSAVLAGRKAMTTSTYDTAIAKPRADAMFNFNFQNADFQTTGTSFTAAADANGKLSGNATTTIPMTLMKVFGFGDQTASVSCSADLQIPNIDVVLVLDVTGSMACRTDGSYCNGGSQSKIVALRAAAKQFYDTLDAQLKKNGANAGQLRFGFVPYDQTVRVTDLFKGSPDTSKGEAPLTNIANTMTVQSRTAVFVPDTVWVRDDTYTPQSYDQTFHASANDSRQAYVAYSTSSPTELDQSNCDLYAGNRRLRAGNTNYDMDPNGSTLYIPAPYVASNAQTTQPTSGAYYFMLTFTRVTPRIDRNQTDPCTRRVTKTRFIQKTVNEFATWRYKEVPLDSSVFKTGAAVSYVRNLNASTVQAPAPGEYNMLDLAKVSNQTGLTIATTRWTGCIEERDTVAATDFNPIPTGAKDLDYLAAGTSDDMRWRPIFNDLTWYRGRVAPVETTANYTQMSDPYEDGSSNNNVQCPTASIRNLNPMTQQEFYAYIDTLQPGGNTYLDIGMIWGLRLIASQGMWGSRNLTSPNGGQISLHIIFLTDGVPVNSAYSYAGYGMEIMASRITGTTGEAAGTLHARRFQALCDAQRGSVNIWAIAFGTSVTGNLSNCADPNRAFQANNASDLNAAFENIAKSVADLRLVQ